MVASLFHNFAKIYNDILIVLDQRKNQIHEYKSLNLTNKDAKKHPQKIT